MWIPRHGILQSMQKLPYTPPLDIYTGATAAYSLRKLRSSYTGPAIVVRRTSDNTLQDIGFDANGNINESSLLSFVGTSDGYIHWWYDQSGNSRTAIQTTTNRQPRIVLSGNIDKQSGKPTIVFNAAASNNLLHPITNELNSSFSLFFVTSANTQSGYAGIFATVTSTTTGVLILSRSSTTDRWGTYGNAADRLANSKITNTGVKLLSMISSNGNSGSYYLNNTTDGTFSDTDGQNTSHIGGISGQFYSGNIQEIIIYNSDQSSNNSGIASNINSYYSIY